MSNVVTSLVRQRDLGIGFTAKSVLYLMADFASDDGRGIYASKVTMANQLETTDRTIRRAVKVLEKAGFIKTVGVHREKNVGTVEYEIDVQAVERMPASNSKGRTDCPGETQYVDPHEQDVARTESPPGQPVTPDTVSARTEGPVTPDTRSGYPGQRVRQTKDNQIEPGGGGSAREVAAIPLSEQREAILTAIGVDPVSGMAGPNGVMLGRLSDMQEARRWQEDLSLSFDEVLSIVAEVVSKKRDGPPKTFTYFRPAMERYAADKNQPKLQPAEGTANGSASTHGRPASRPNGSVQSAAVERLVAGFSGALHQHRGGS